jgi:hypothetical protein
VPFGPKKAPAAASRRCEIWKRLRCGWGGGGGSGTKYDLSKKIYRLKEDQAFSLSLELGQREKVARHPSADFLCHSVGGGGDFVDTAIAIML